MKTVEMANEPKTGQKRAADITLGNVSASAQVILIDKDDNVEIMRAVPVSINLGAGFIGQQSEDSETVKNAKLVAIDTIEGALSELFKVMNQ